MAGGLETHKSKAIEEFASAFENVEYTFRFNRRTLAVFGLCGVLLPLIIYKGHVAEFHKYDRVNERERKFL
eukprot:jgi/Chlat1/695/Chrsp104S01161